ncbi:unnamed protein product, partial [Polarella glacialis]
VLSADCCERVAAFVDAALKEAERQVARALLLIAAAADEETRAEIEQSHFGNVRCRFHRRELKLPLGKDIQEALECLAASAGELMSQRVSTEGRLFELSCLVSDPGADRQPLHPDTLCGGAAGCAPLLTILVALQDTTE